MSAATDFIQSPAGAGVATGLGSIIQGVISAKAAGKANKVQKKVAREQMAFQQEMSSTAYQRSMADMRAAGLNPILAYQQGGASTPSGAMPNIREVDYGQGLSEAFESGIGTAITKRRADQEVKNMKETEVGIKESNKNLRATRRQIEAHIELQKKPERQDDRGNREHGTSEPGGALGNVGKGTDRPSEPRPGRRTERSVRLQPLSSGRESHGRANPSTPS